MQSGKGPRPIVNSQDEDEPQGSSSPPFMSGSGVNQRSSEREDANESAERESGIQLGRTAPSSSSTNVLRETDDLGSDTPELAALRENLPEATDAPAVALESRVPTYSFALTLRPAVTAPAPRRTRSRSPGLERSERSSNHRPARSPPRRGGSSPPPAAPKLKSPEPVKERRAPKKSDQPPWSPPADDPEDTKYLLVRIYLPFRTEDVNHWAICLVDRDDKGITYHMTGKRPIWSRQTPRMQEMNANALQETHLVAKIYPILEGFITDALDKVKANDTEEVYSNQFYVLDCVEYLVEAQLIDDGEWARWTGRGWQMLWRKMGSENVIGEGKYQDSDPEYNWHFVRTTEGKRIMRHLRGEGSSDEDEGPSWYD